MADSNSSNNGGLQAYLAVATRQAADELMTALKRIPPEKRGWSPGGTARPACDQVAECAVLNGYTINLIQTRLFSGDSMATYAGDRAAAVARGEEDVEKLNALLQESTGRVIAAIQAFPDEALSDEVAMPWGPMKMAAVLAYPYWNMTYHQGQVNYIAAILGCLD